MVIQSSLLWAHFFLHYCKGDDLQWQGYPCKSYDMDQWSVVNPSLYASCFTGSAKSSAPRCELCQATTHTERECAQQGDSDPDMQQRVKAMESVVLALSRQQPRRAPAGPWRPSGEVCRLFNRNSCSYPRCRHTHVCSSCGGNHPVVSCPYEGARAQPGPASGRFVTGPHHKPYWQHLLIPDGNFQHCRCYLCIPW